MGSPLAEHAIIEERGVDLEHSSLYTQSGLLYRLFVGIRELID